ncbi:MULTISPECIES: hypothetical protein [unclassified Luteococcus]|uniref:hypothetical protein n=1 Tax=unclassified Luteococcus TaxID=2639923 RepID=UPI00313E63CB
MSSPALAPSRTAESADAPEGTWAVVVGALAVVATTLASGVFFKGFLDLAKLPGPTPSMDQIPDTPAAQAAVRWMQIGGGLYVVAAVLAVVGLAAGIHFARRPCGYGRGVWAIALSACTPVLAIMLLTGMGAT